MKNFCTDNSSDLNDIIADLTATIKTNTDSNWSPTQAKYTLHYSELKHNIFLNKDNPVNILKFLRLEVYNFFLIHFDDHE